MDIMDAAENKDGIECSIIVKKDIPKIAPDEVLIRVVACGVCESEYHGWADGSAKGKTLGHESIGIIEEIGSEIKGFALGDRVTGIALEAFAEYVKAKAAWIAHVPKELSDDEAIGETLACLMSGIIRTPILPGQRSAIVGCGYMGLRFIQLMKIKGAAAIVAVDPREEARENALRFGASDVYSPDCLPREYISDELYDDLFSEGFETIAEAAGNQPALDLASRMTRAHGMLSIVGYHVGKPRTVDMQLWNWKALSVINAHERRMWLCADYIERVFRLVCEKRLNTKDMITNVYALDELDLAYSHLRDKPKGYIKGVIHMN